jgi:hypothetical protein
MNESSNIKQNKGGGHRKKHRMRRLSTSSSLSSSSSDIDIASYNALIMTQNYMLEQEIRKKLQEYFDKYNKYKNMPVESASKKDISVKGNTRMETTRPDTPSNSDLDSSSSSEGQKPQLKNDPIDEQKINQLKEILIDLTKSLLEKDANNNILYNDGMYIDFIQMYESIGESALSYIYNELNHFIEALATSYANFDLEQSQIKYIYNINKLHPNLDKYIINNIKIEILRLQSALLFHSTDHPKHTESDSICTETIQSYKIYLSLYNLFTVMYNKKISDDQHTKINQYYYYKGTHYQSN